MAYLPFLLNHKVARTERGGTFGGRGLIRKAYDAAIAERYRFFSYGDAMIIL